MLNIRLTAKSQAHCYAMGFITLFTLGTLALIALLFAAFWLLVQLVAIFLAGIIEACNAIGSTFQAADPLVKTILLIAIGALIYQIVRKVWR